MPDFQISGFSKFRTTMLVETASSDTSLADGVESTTVALAMPRMKAGDLCLFATQCGLNSIGTATEAVCRLFEPSGGNPQIDFYLDGRLPIMRVGVPGTSAHLQLNAAGIVLRDGEGVIMQQRVTVEGGGGLASANFNKIQLVLFTQV